MNSKKCFTIDGAVKLLREKWKPFISKNQHTHLITRKKRIPIPTNFNKHPAQTSPITSISPSKFSGTTRAIFISH
jgi:hypothetical protein